MVTRIKSSQITDGTIVNADVNSSAAIDDSKLTGLASSATTDTTNAANIGSGGNPEDKTLTVTLTGASTNNFLRIMANGEGTLGNPDSPQWDDPAFFINGVTGATNVTGTVPRDTNRTFSGGFTRISDITSSTCAVTFTVGANYHAPYNYVSGNSSGIALIEEIVSST